MRYWKRGLPWEEITDRRCKPVCFQQEVWVKGKYYGGSWQERKVWHYEAAMIGSFPGVFMGCESNHDVEACLRKAKVIRKNNQTDSEYCALVINFSCEKSAFAFAKRLQAYVQSKAKVAV